MGRMRGKLYILCCFKSPKKKKKFPRTNVNNNKAERKTCHLERENIYFSEKICLKGGVPIRKPKIDVN